MPRPFPASLQALDNASSSERLLAIVASVDHAGARATLSSPGGEWALSRLEAESIWQGLRPGCLIGFHEDAPGVASRPRLMV